MVAVVNVPVVLNDKAVTAGLAHRADSWLGVTILGKGGIEHLDKELSNITYDPIIENVDKEFAIAFRTYTPRSKPCSFRLRRNYHRPVEILPVNNMFDGRKELHEMAPYRFEE